MKVAPVFCLSGLLFILLAGCNTPSGRTDKRDSGESAPPAVLYQEADRQIAEQLFRDLADHSNVPVGELVALVGKRFLETPYVAHTLEIPDSLGQEQLVINLRELDCTTFGENCLALARTLKSGEAGFESYLAELQAVRYRDGILEGYPSRLHYFCDWIHNNQEMGLVRDVSLEAGGSLLEKKVDFMSTHPDAYRQLKEDSLLVDVIRQQEADIAGRELYYIPEEQVEELEDRLQHGDIVGISTDIEGLAVMHVGILVRQEGRIHLMHASSAAEKVVLSKDPLANYLEESKRATGIMVARPL